MYITSVTPYNISSLIDLIFDRHCMPFHGEQLEKPPVTLKFRKTQLTHITATNQTVTPQKLFYMAL